MMMLLAIGAAAVVCPPLLLGSVVWGQNKFRPVEYRRGTWYWRLWWFYGYRGLFQLNWAWKAR